MKATKQLTKEAMKCTAQANPHYTLDDVIARLHDMGVTEVNRGQVTWWIVDVTTARANYKRQRAHQLAAAQM